MPRKENYKVRRDKNIEPKRSKWGFPPTNRTSADSIYFGNAHLRSLKFS